MTEPDYRMPRTQVRRIQEDAAALEHAADLELTAADHTADPHRARMHRRAAVLLRVRARAMRAKWRIFT